MGETAKLHLDLEALVGSTIHDRYRVETLLGSGGMGAVFKARHTGLQRGVAIKVLHPEIGRDPSVSKRFDREAHSASRLDHPNCVRVTDFGTTENGTKYLVMELLEGGDLDGRLGQPWPPDRAIATIEQVLFGLEHAHHVGIVHRDLKPENIFVTKDFRGEEVIKIVDFGIAKLLDEQGAEKLTRQGVVFGTPRYMSPEQAAGGKIDERTDLYAVGLILYELLAGHPPFQSDDAAQLLRMHIMAPPPALAGVPEPLAKIVEKLLEKSKSDRFASAREVLDALAQITSESKNSLGAATAPTIVPSGAPASSGVAWRPAPEPTPVVRGGTMVAETGELAAVSMAAARAVTRTGSHVGVGRPATGPVASLSTGSHPGVGQPATGPFASLSTGSHPGVGQPATGSHPSVAAHASTTSNSTEGSSASMAEVSNQRDSPKSSRLPIALTGIIIMLVLAGLGVYFEVWVPSSTESTPPPSQQTEPPAPAPAVAGEAQSAATPLSPPDSQTAEDPIRPDTSPSTGPASRPSKARKPAAKSNEPASSSGDIDTSSSSAAKPSDPTSEGGADPRHNEREAAAEQQKREREEREAKRGKPEDDRGKGPGNGKGQGKANDEKHID